MTRKATRQLDREGFALKLHEALTADGITTEAFARQIDKTMRTVQRWRSGESEPGGADLVVVARALSRDPSWFYEHMEGAA